MNYNVLRIIGYAMIGTAVGIYQMAGDVAAKERMDALGRDGASSA